LSEHQDLLAEDDKSRQQGLELDSFIVEAPAGAGKTELLTQRFLRLLQTVDAPEEIIAITFTNKAASEMKSRIMDSLKLAADGLMPPQAHKQMTFALGQQALARSTELQWNLLDTPSRLRIYTIDSLSSNLARQMPLLSRFGAQPGVRDDASMFYQDAASRTLENLDDADLGPVVQRALRYFDNDSFRLQQLLAEMLAKRDQWLNYTQGSSTADAAEAALAQMVMADIKVAASYVGAPIQLALMPVARYAASNLTEEESIYRLLDWESELNADVADLSMWQALADLLLTGTGGFRKRLDKNMGLQAIDEAKPYKETLTNILDSLRDIKGAEAAIARLRLLPQAEHDEDSWQLIATLGLLLNMAVAELWLVFQAHGEVDFVEISQRSLQALEDDAGNPTDLALKIDYRVQHLLVDEFQDTSPTQIKLIRALTQGWMPGDGRTLFAVGDPMQSIYRFRKANVGLFLRVAQEGIGHVRLKSLKLWRNNRSCPPVVEWVNQAFAQVFPEADSVSRGAIHYRSFVATRKSEEGSGVYVHAMLDGQVELDTDDETELMESDVRQLEANQIIRIIQDTWADDANKKIAVLVRARSHLHVLVTEIRRNHPDLSFQAVEIEELANRQIVQDLLSLTNALHQRADRVHWLAILRAPWCGLKLADLHALIAGDKYSTIPQLMHDEGRLRTMSEDGRQRLSHVRTVMDEAMAHHGRQSTSRWVHGVWLMLGGADCLWEAGDVRDVQAFFERIAQLEAVGQFSTEQLALEVQKLYAAPDAEADDRLQFMTIHKSKGLEFDTVILPGLDRKTGGNEQPLLLWEEVAVEGISHDAAETSLVVAPYIPKGRNQSSHASPYDYLKLLENERAEYEDARVLYVAATRAERCLHLLGAAKLDSKTGQPKAPKNTFLEMLWPIVHAEFSADNVLKEQATKNLSNTIQLADFAPQLVRLKAPSIPALLGARNLPPNSPQVESALAQTDEPEVRSIEADIGTLAHQYMEIFARQGLEKWPESRVLSLSQAMLHWFKQRGHAGDKSTLAAQQVIALLTTTLLSEKGRWVLQPRPDAQSELAIEALHEQGVRKRVLDRTFTEAGVRWIIDYKTATFGANPDESALRAVAEQYREQLESYASLFAEDSLPVCKAIFFLSVGRLVVI